MSAPLPSSTLDTLSDSYRRHGFNLGYTQAVTDQLNALVQSAEAYLRAHPDPVAVRPVVYGFVADLQSRLTALTV